MEKPPLSAAPLAGLFLILTLFAYVAVPTPQGLTVDIAACVERGDDVLMRYAVLIIQSDGSVRINYDPIARSDLARRLKQIFGTRKGKGIYLWADRDVPFQSVAEVIDIAKTQMDYVAIITPSLRNGTGCRLIIPRAEMPERPVIDLGIKMD